MHGHPHIRFKNICAIVVDIYITAVADPQICVFGIKVGYKLVNL